MSKFAPVCPIRMYKELKALGPEYFGDYFLLLAHDVVAYAEEYAEVFDDGQKRTIIMDNSVIELGTSVDCQMLVDACHIVGADVLAMPDVLEDSLGTVQASLDFLHAWDSMDLTGLTKIPELMFIPQGIDLLDYRTCATGALDEGIPMDWIGIARNTTGRIVPTRLDLIGFFSVMCPSSKLHLLGFSNDTDDDLKCAQSEHVEGIDSAVPIRTIRTLAIGDSIGDPGPRGDWWETGRLGRRGASNVAYMHEILKGVKKGSHSNGRV